MSEIIRNMIWKCCSAQIDLIYFFGQQKFSIFFERKKFFFMIFFSKNRNFFFKKNRKFELAQKSFIGRSDRGKAFKSSIYQFLASQSYDNAMDSYTTKVRGGKDETPCYMTRVVREMRTPIFWHRPFGPMGTEALKRR